MLAPVKRRFGPEQSASLVAAQVEPMQHAPVGGGGCEQGLGSHTPSIVHVAAHALCNVDAHEPSAAQHEPVGGGGCWQGLGSHAPSMAHAAPHAACSVEVQEPSAAQHETRSARTCKLR